MTNPGACASCGAAIENETVTGIFCAACHARDVAPQPGWRAYVTGPVGVGLAGGLAPFALTVTVNGLNYVAAAGGGLGAAMGVLGVVLGLRAPSDVRGKRIGVAVVVTLLGAWQLLRSGLIH